MYSALKSAQIFQKLNTVSSPTANVWSDSPPAGCISRITTSWRPRNDLDHRRPRRRTITWTKWDESSNLPWPKIVQESKYNNNFSLVDSTYNCKTRQNATLSRARKDKETFSHRSVSFVLSFFDFWTAFKEFMGGSTTHSILFKLLKTAHKGLFC